MPAPLAKSSQKYNPGSLAQAKAVAALAVLDEVAAADDAAALVELPTTTPTDDVSAEDVAADVVLAAELLVADELAPTALKSQSSRFSEGP